MKTISKPNPSSGRWLSVLALSLFTAVGVSAQPFGQWDFNGQDLTATSGSDLTYVDGTSGTTHASTAFGSTADLGIPSIDGTNAMVMHFPANSPGMGYSMPTPGPNGRGSYVDNYTLIMDVLYPAGSDHQPRPLLETDENFINSQVGTDLAIGTNNGVGLVGGTLDGEIQPDTWYRIGLVVETNTLRAYINGAWVGQQDADSDRLVLTPSSTALILAESLVGGAAEGYVSSIQLRDTALSTDQMTAIGGPSADGIPAVIPSIPSYIVSWKPPGEAAFTVTDLGVVINPGEASVDTNTIVLKLNDVVQDDVQITSNAVITVLKPAAGPLTPGNTYTLEVSYTDSQVGSKSFSKQFKAALLFEDFEELTLGTNIDEGLPTVYSNVWTKTPPTDWVLDDSQMPNYVMGVQDDPGQDGVGEWNGWSFAANTFWGVITDNQDRQKFTYGQGTVAVADPDEWDDDTHPEFDTNNNPLYFNSYLSTGPIDISGYAPNSIFMKFDSSWRPEGGDDWGGANNQTAVITVSYDGGDPIEVLRWESLPGPNFHDYNVNEKVSLLMQNPAGASSMVVKFGLIKGGNDWWWAFDNLEVNVGDIPSGLVEYLPEEDATGVGPQPELGATIAPGTTAINPGSIQLFLDGSLVTTTLTTNVQGQLVVRGKAPSIFPNSSDHTNMLVYTDSLNGPQTNTWSYSVAYNEITLGTPVWYENFDGAMEASFPDGWVATNDTTELNTAFDLNDPDSASYENWVVISEQRLASVFSSRRQNVRPATLNGQPVEKLASGNFAYAESDNRGGSQVQVLFSPVIDLTGITGVQLGFNSIYEQNQDSLGAVEYSIDGGATWLPALYMVAEDDVIAGDPVATLDTVRGDQAWGTNYGAFIGATPDASFGPYISGRVDDDSTESKRIEVLSLPMADNEANVRLRFLQTGTASWYFGIDNVGIYGSGAGNVAPTFASQPQGADVPANTSAQLLAGVDPYSTRPLSFQWQHDSTNLPNATVQSLVIESMQATDAGDYRLIVSNVSGSVTSEVATLTYLMPESPTITEDPADTSAIADLIGSFTVTAAGTEPLSYQWLFNGSPLSGATSATLNLEHVMTDQAGQYSVVVSNNFGAVTSVVATLTVQPAPDVEITGQWDFDCGTLQASVGKDLVPYDATVAGDTQFGTTTSFGIADIGGSPANVLYFAPTIDSWGGYRMLHGAAPNGGGSYVNRYTVIYDIYYPASSSGKWRCFLQTNTGNSNDGDIFVNTSNGIGISGDYTGTVQADTWHRIVFVFDLPYSTLKKYIDGTLVGTQTIDGVDGRFSLDPYALLFGDNDGDNQPAYVNSIQFRNGVMTDDEVSALGGATTAAGIPGAVPRICSLTLSGNTVTLNWPGAPDLKVQKATSLTAPSWSDVTGSLGANTVDDTITGDEAYYRLVRQ